MNSGYHCLSSTHHCINFSGSMQKKKQKIILNLMTLQFTLWNKPQIQINVMSLQNNVSIVFNSYINIRGIDTRDEYNLNLWKNKKEKKIYIETCEWVYLQISCISGLERNIIPGIGYTKKNIKKKRKKPEAATWILQTNNSTLCCTCHRNIKRG